MDIFCHIMTVVRTLRSGAWVNGRIISGHDFQTLKEKTPPNIHILECRLCGYQSFGWDWKSLEHLK